MIAKDIFLDHLRSGASEYGINLDDNTLSLFWQYYELLVHWNSRVNLVSKGDIDRFVDYHVLDSLKTASVFDFLRVRTMLDFGSGAGIPGIPLSLAFPHLTTTLVESRTKRCSFLNEVVRSIPDLNVSVLHSGITSLSDIYNGSFDTVITRATVSIADFFVKTSRFIHRGGTLIAIKGEHFDHEISEIKTIFDNRHFTITKSVPKTVCSVRQGTIIFISHI